MPELRTILLGRLAATLALLASAVGAQAAPPAEPVNSFKDWTVVCDNLRNCEADGFAADEVEKAAILRLTRDGAPGAPARIDLVLMDDTSAAPRGKPMVLAIDGRPVMTVPANGDGTASLTPVQVGPLLGAARNGTALSIRLEDNEVGVVSLAGMVAALRMVDDQQRRVGTVTAMVAKGAAPLSAVPPQPAPPVVRRAPAVAQTGLAAKPPAGVKALAAKAECEVDQGEAPGEPEVHRLAADTVLWQIPCGAGAYNFTSLLVIADAKGGGARLAPLDEVGDGLVVNVQYDPKTRILSAYAKGRGVGDCGESQEWAWTGQTFVLTHAASMPVCQGQGDWPTSYQAKVE
jgi:hypothetical protein